MDQPNLLSASEAVRRIAAGELSAEALLRACLEAIEAREAQVGAWAFLDPDYALHQARQLDRGPVRGALHGLPLAVKDIFDTHDMPTAYGSPIYAGNRPVWDAACVAAARAQGAVILGKTVTTEFAYFQPGRTANPHDPAHTPGGSSSGSAAAVAAHMVPLALGTQTAGSVIRPAAFCGVVGYKPGFGMVSRAGIKPFAESLDTVGMFARCVEDVALLASAVSGRQRLRLDDAPAQAPRIGVCRTWEWPAAQAETVAALEGAAAALGRAGAHVREVALPAEFAGLAQAQAEIMAFEAARAFAYERAAHRDGLGARLRELLAQGDALDPGRCDAHLMQAQDCRQRLAGIFGDCDVLLAPSAPGEAPRGLDATGDPVFSRMWTLLHAPCVHLPFAQGPNGLPVGVQVVGMFGSDARTLAAAAWAQRALTRA